MAGKAIWKPLELPLSGIIVNQNRIPGGILEISATIKGLKNAGLGVTNLSAFNSPIWSVKKTDVSWRMTVDYQKFKQVVALITAAEHVWCLT